MVSYIGTVSSSTIISAMNLNDTNCERNQCSRINHQRHQRFNLDFIIVWYLVHVTFDGANSHCGKYTNYTELWILVSHVKEILWNYFIQILLVQFRYFDNTVIIYNKPSIVYKWSCVNASSFEELQKQFWSFDFALTELN